MDDQACPRCKTTKYRNPSLKLLVNVCGHALCESCVDLLFVRGSGACVECGTALRRNNFRLQLFEDAAVEKEVDIRKRIMRDFNKKEDEFNNLGEYNDYLEMVETIVFNLVSGVDVEDTRLQIEQYKKENLDSIKKNRSKLSHDEEYLELLIEREQHELQFNRHVIQQEELQKKKEKAKNKQALIDELMFSDLPADRILATHREHVTQQQQAMAAVKPQATTFSSGIQIGKQDLFLPVPKPESHPEYSYRASTLDYCGPEPPTWQDVHSKGYLNHVRAATDPDKGGGFQTYMACQRALQDAFCGLFFSVHDETGVTSSHCVTQPGRHSMSMDTS